MKIAVTATQANLDGPVDPRFGRCSYFLVVDTDTMEFEAVENPHIAVGGGAGIQSGQMIADLGVSSVLTGNCGPNAHRTLDAAGVGVVTGCVGTVRKVVDQFNKGELQPSRGPSVDSHFGVGGGGRGMGPGGGGGRGRGGRGPGGGPS